MAATDQRIPHACCSALSCIARIQDANCCAGQSLEVCGKSVLRQSWLESLWKQSRRLCGVRSVLAVVGKVLWPFLDAWDSVRLRTTPTQWNVPARYGPHGKLFFFFLLKKGVDQVKACALIGLHMMIDEKSGWSEKCSSVSSSSLNSLNFKEDEFGLVSQRARRLSDKPL